MGFFNKKRVIDIADTLSNFNPVKRVADLLSYTTTKKTLKEHFLEKTDLNINKLREIAKNNPREAVNTIRDDKNNFFESSNKYELSLLEADCLINLYKKEKNGVDLIDARMCCIRAVQAEKNEIKSKAKTLYEKIIREYNLKSIILGINRAHKECIMIVKNMEECFYDKNLLVLTDECIPNEFIFPQRDYQYNQVYIRHPHRDNTYVNFTDVPNIFVEEKIMELCRILVNLGAKKITIESTKGSELINNFFNNFNISAQGEDGEISASVKADTNYGRTSTGKTNNIKKYTLESDPYDYPRFPEDRIWYKNDFKLCNFADMRLKGNMLSYKENIHNSDVSLVNKKFSIDINALLQEQARKLGVDFHYDQNSQKDWKFEEEWIVQAEFKSLTDFKRN